LLGSVLTKAPFDNGSLYAELGCDLDKAALFVAGFVPVWAFHFNESELISIASPNDKIRTTARELSPCIDLFELLYDEER
jgi:hypothetical protein